MPKLYDGVLSSLDFSGSYAPGAGVLFGFSTIVFSPKVKAGFRSSRRLDFSGWYAPGATRESRPESQNILSD